MVLFRRHITKIYCNILSSVHCHCQRHCTWQRRPQDLAKEENIFLFNGEWMPYQFTTDLSKILVCVEHHQTTIAFLLTYKVLRGKVTICCHVTTWWRVATQSPRVPHPQSGTQSATCWQCAVPHCSDGGVQSTDI